MSGLVPEIKDQIKVVESALSDLQDELDTLKNLVIDLAQEDATQDDVF